MSEKQKNLKHLYRLMTYHNEV